jgi:hypothetical protein
MFYFAPFRLVPLLSGTYHCKYIELMVTVLLKRMCARKSHLYVFLKTVEIILLLVLFPSFLPSASFLEVCGDEPELV